MEIERRHASVPGELLEYLRANPTAPQQPAGGGVQFHVHHHYAPANPIPPEHIVHQGPPQSMAQKILPWLYVALLACIVLTACALAFAIVAIVVVALLAGLIVLGLVAAYIIHSMTGAVEAKAKATVAEAKAKARARR